jgi:hypothetical protein
VFRYNQPEAVLARPGFAQQTNSRAVSQLFNGLMGSTCCRCRRWPSLQRISPDGRRYTFVLRPGVRFTANVFAGGRRAVTTTDFVYSFRRGLDAGGQLRLDFRGRCWRNPTALPAIPLLWPWCPLRIHLRSRSFRSGHPHHAYAYVMPTGR